jgi:transposase
MHLPQVWLAVEAVDMRVGADGLALRVQAMLGRSPCDGAAYAFRNKRSTLIKLVIWDGNGVWLCVRRLHHGTFVWPALDAKECILTQAQWQWLTDGVDWRRMGTKPPAELRV